MVFLMYENLDTNLQVTVFYAVRIVYSKEFYFFNYY